MRGAAVIGSRSGRVSTRLGEVAYVRSGHGAPLVLLHGNGQSWHEFQRVLRPLSERFDVVAWDHPGQGDSDPIPPRTEIEDHAEALAALVDHLGLRRAALVGSSIGAFVAAHLARSAPAKVSGVVLCEAQWRPTAWWEERWEIVERMFGVPQLTESQIAARLHTTVDADLIARWNIDRHKAGARTMIDAMRALARYDLGAAMSALSVPALLLYGAAGPTVDNARVLHACKPGAAVHVIDGAGHFPALDAPEAFVQVITNFVSNHSEAS